MNELLTLSLCCGVCVFFPLAMKLPEPLAIDTRNKLITVHTDAYRYPKGNIKKSCYLHRLELFRIVVCE